MSALAALVMQDGRPAERQRLHDMLQAMSRRGPDGVSVAADGCFGLGLALLETSGDAAFVETERACVALDGFLANRKDLAAALGLAGAAADAELLLKAYERWGEGFTKALLGEFVVAVWDKAARSLLVVRDHFGVKPLFYSRHGSATHVASDQRALLATGASSAPDPRAVANFLAGLPSAPADTNFEHVKTLPAGHLLWIGPRGELEIRCYWSLDLPQPVPHADAPGELRRLLDEALRDRTRLRQAPAFALSGGLDSSSLACLARRQASDLAPLHTFSMTYAGSAAGDEREFIDAVLNQGGFSAHFVECGDIAPFGEFAEFMAQHGGPPIGPNTVAAHALYAAIAAEGHRVMIGGHGGDEAVSYGNGRLLELAEAGRYLSLWSEMKCLSQVQGFPVWPAYGRFVRHSVRRFAATRLRSGARPRPARREAEPSATTGLLRDEIIDRFDLKAPLAYTEQRIEGVGVETAQHYLLLTNPLQAKAFELIDQSAAASGVEVRHPFWDKRVVEFCLSLPSEEKLGGGLNRRVLRRAMRGLVPDAIINRYDKFDFTHQIVAPLLRHHDALITDRLYRRADLIEPYVNMDRIRGAFQRLTAGNYSGYDFQWVWRCVWASLWLEQLQASDHQPAAVA